MAKLLGIALVAGLVLAAGGTSTYQEIICADRVGYHRFLKYAQTQEGKVRIMDELQKLRSSPKATTTQISNLEKALSSAPTINVAPVGWDCSLSVALGNESADDIFDEYLRGERHI